MLHAEKNAAATTSKNSRPLTAAPLSQTAPAGYDTPVCGACAGMPRFLVSAGRATSVNFGTVVGDATEDNAHDETAGSGDAAITAPETPDQDESSANDTASVSGEGPEVHAVAFSLSLQGRTDATYSSRFSAPRLRRRPATGCSGCEDADCVHVTGTLVSTFRVNTTVTLPSVSDFPDLTPCQQRRVRAAIRNVLSPHEQEHVRAFRTYRGTIRTPIDLTVCNADVDAEIETLHNDIEGPRQAAAQAASDALDPFEFEVDLDCEDR